MSLDMLLTLLIDVVAPLVAADPNFFPRATLRVYVALDRRVSCRDIAADLATVATDLGRKRLRGWTDREQILLSSAIETLLPEVASSQLTMAQMTQIIVKLTGGQRDEIDIQQAIAELEAHQR